MCQFLKLDVVFDSPSPWFDSLSIPVYCAALSASILIFHAVFTFSSVRTLSLSVWATSEGPERVEPTNVSKVRDISLSFGITRLCGSATLIGLAFASLKHQNIDPVSVIAFQLCLVYVYVSILAFVSISVRGWDAVATRHSNALLAVIFLTYVYRDLFPLATFNQSQQDIDEGWFLWAKLSILTAIGVVLPLSVPRASLDKPLDSLASPEETASLISLITYSFLDPLILLANRLPHLSYDLLPPLAYQNGAKNLRSNAFPHLDASLKTKPKHVFFGLMRVFRSEYATMVILAAVQVATNFSNPVAINRLLDYIEREGHGATMRPWFWITLLFVGPTFGSIASQWSKFISVRPAQHDRQNRMSIQTEAILTELVFEHSLCVRVKAETSGEKTEMDEASTTVINGRNLVGKLNNLVTTDLQNIVNAGETLPQPVVYILQSCLGVWFLHEVLGWAAFVGLGVTVMVFPLPGYIGGRIRFVQQGLMQQTDTRVQKVSETMSLLRLIKLFAWEKTTEERISEARESELKWLWKSKALQLSIAVVNFTIPTLTMLATYGTYSSKVFSSMTVFDIFRTQLHEFFASLTTLVTGRTELLDIYSDDPVSHNYDEEAFGFNNATFSWSSDDASAALDFRLQIEGQLRFKQNCINLIVGPTGSGKTSILMALLGEMHFIPATRDSWFNLPRSAGVAYAAQQSWVQNDTIRANIVFGAPFDIERYNKVIYQCGLERDLAMFEAGDLQEIGEGGVTLSGGQRARVTLARAIYSSASILLLDDVLAALDVHTAQWIVDKCFAGDLLADRTTLLVTHNIALTKSIAGFMVSLGSDGLLQSQGPVSEVLAKIHDLPLEVIDNPNKSPLQEIGEAPEEPQVSGKLVIAEEIAIGHMSWAALNLYVLALGGRNFVFYFTGLMLCMFVTDSLINLQPWYLGYFASQYDNHEASQVDVVYCSYLVYLLGMVRASTVIHTKLIQSILGTTLRFLDVTPTSRMIARCTQDLRAVDANIGETLWNIVDVFFFAGIKLGAILFLAPSFLLPAGVLLLAGTWIGAMYTKAQLSVKREMYARAPILGHFGAAINGLVSIRAYGAQEAFIETSLKHINHYTRSARTFHNLSRWIAVRMDILGTVFITVLATYMVYFQKQGSSSIGFSLNMASGFGMIILFGVRFVVDGRGSLERINNYLQIEQEPKPTIDGSPPAHWPSSGNLCAENLSARYSADGPDVLRDISFNIKGGERIGIVGRTGSGKSSLTLALLRAIFTEGLVYYNGIPTSSLNLEAVRRNITIIPQTPELVNGSLRTNLDPLGEHDDSSLNAALRAAGLFSLQGGTNNESAKITLDTMLASGGGNLSQGQRQILALGRALIRGSKILILDEDYETDKVIQESLRTELGKDVTLLTVAHRLQSIMDADRIMVLDAGMIVEFASPHELLAKEDGALRALVDESKDRDILYSMASK
ncbi:P-loop containing nucleoside triphosphate hydrolase protein [Mycena galopus ATCC 62051]|nr:P-loop containing nucleoside triphosphate hydrolase protein [Mycena galopus ATCC 62051]